MHNRSVSVVIPVYNSEGSLAEVVARLCTVLWAEEVLFEIILVNIRADFGSDDTGWDGVDALVTAEDAA